MAPPCMKDICHLFASLGARPSSPETTHRPHVRHTFPLCPRKNTLIPQHWDEHEFPYWLGIVSGSSTATFRADRATIFTRLNFYLDRRFLRVLDPAGFPVYKRFEFLDPIEDSLDLHLRSFSDRWVVGASIFSEGCGVNFLTVHPMRRCMTDPFPSVGIPS
uniref:Uncharacterized protein n=1 Tax=Candidatus Kentrum sp. LFY TaxID=2126342 RepID=A0A450V509_9GAMM|nr:MAG: hypothetical protein BECKLFY1418B_GA0070995_10018 [Candidatus Kentron sp. LFY]VFJ99766.1 MAG: hypothetical protein BECKLFY1418A_GA0070994_11056 [Candidatus Kentron sp. LFY]